MLSYVLVGLLHHFQSSVDQLEDLKSQLVDRQAFQSVAPLLLDWHCPLAEYRQP